MTAVKNRGRTLARPSARIAIVVLFTLAGLLCVREGRAQLLTYAGNFTAATGGPPNQDVAGVPFQPRAVVFFWTTQTTATFGNNAEAGYGFAAGAGLERVASYAVGHNVAAPGNSKRFQSTTRSVAFFTQGGTVNGEAHFVQFNVNGFRLRWDAFPSVGYLVHYMAIGGSHVTNQTVGEFTLSACADQTAPVCNDGAGEQEDVINTGFEPDFLMFLSVDSNTLGASVSEGRISIGFAGRSEGGTITQAAISTAARSSGATNVATSRQLEGRALLEKTHALFGDTLEAEVTTMLGSGFRINKRIHSTGTETRVHYLALRGGQYKMKELTKPTVAAPYTDPQAQNTVGFNPRGLFFFSRVLDPGTGAAEIGRIVFGAADSQAAINEEATYFEDHIDSPTDEQLQRATPPYDNTFARQGNSTSSAILMTQAGDCYPLIDPPPNATTTLADCQDGPDAGGVRITGQANVASLDAAGFTLNWTTNELVNLSALTNEDEARVVYVALGNEPTQVYYRSIGTAADYSVGSVTVVNGSTLVTGVGGTQWLTNNRGTGDRITIAGTDYMVLGPVTENTLTLSSPFTGIGGTYPYVLARQFATLQAWEDCISFTTPCTYFPVTSNNLVADVRAEVGVAYKETVFSPVTIDGSVTDPTHGIALTATPENWHRGLPGTGVVLNIGASTSSGVSVYDDFVRVEYLEITGGTGSASGIEVNNTSGGFGANGFLLRNNLIHNVSQYGLALYDGDQITDAYNNIVYSTQVGIRVLGGFQAWTRIRLLNNTLYNNAIAGVDSSEVGFSGSLTLDNNIAATNTTDFTLAGPPNAASASNLSTDTTAAAASPFNGGLISMDVDASIQFVNRLGGDLHIGPFSVARNQALDRSSIFSTDIDGALRLPGSFSWDIGADEQGATTLVTLRSFTAHGLDGAVELKWETASELDNLGFHLYRARSEGGPYERVTTSLIPGLGSSPAGASYSYRDFGLENGLTHFYKLEDVETTGGTTLHGPVSATPLPGVVPQEPTPEDSALLRYGDPRATDLRIVSRSQRELVLELRTEGFEALPQEDGSVRLHIPGFLEEGEPGSPAVPYKRTWVDGVSGRRVRLISAAAEDVEVFSSLRPQAVSSPTVIASALGAVRPGRAPSRENVRFRGRGFYPEAWARLVSEGYQGESKKALVELSPLRWDRERGQLVLAKKLTLRLAFAGSDARRRDDGGPKRATTVHLLVTRERGLHAVRFEEVWGKSRSGISSSDLRLSRDGEPVAYHLAPRASRFGPGSVLYFWSEGPSSNPYGNESVFELEQAPGGRTMEVVDGTPSGAALPFYWHRVEREENRYYQAALLEARDLWLWDVLLAPVTKSFGFEVKELASTLEPPRLALDLQGVSDFKESPDHHLRVSVNGTLVTETSFEGKTSLPIEVELPSGLLREGANELTIENVGDTEADYSMVMLDRFAVTYPRRPSAGEGILEGTFHGPGRAEVTEAGGLPLILEGPGPRWVEGAVRADSTVRFEVEAGRRYTVVREDAVRKPELLTSSRASLRNPRRRADYLLVAPEAFLDAAKPLLDLRARQGLRTLAVPIEQVYSEFGFGEPRPEALREFLAYAYHDFRKPAPRYVLLLGDATYDFKDYLGTGVKNQVPPLMVKTSYLWTASDGAYAAVNGEDALPDLAIGRLPAANRDEARAMVEKIVAYEEGGLSPARGTVVLVADNPDAAGDFESDADEIAAGVLALRHPDRIDLGRLGVDATRDAITRGFDRGASVVSYLGHGGIHLWAHEDIFNASQVGSLGPQVEQPLVLTLNCLNGYFHFPYFNSLAEELVKARGKGAIAAFSPSGLSLNDQAQVLHKALLEELASGKHRRLGDAVLAAQSAYADSGAFPELLSIYHLLGDPALNIR